MKYGEDHPAGNQAESLGMGFLLESTMANIRTRSQVLKRPMQASQHGRGNNAEGDMQVVDRRWTCAGCTAEQDHFAG